MIYFDSLKLFASGRWIFLRWFFLFGLVLLFGLWQTNGEIILSNSFRSLVIFFLFIGIVINLGFLIWYKLLYSKHSAWGLFLLNLSQIVLDLVLAIVLVSLFASSSQLVPLLFLLPIITAIVLMSPIWSIIVSAISIFYLLILDLLSGEIIAEDITLSSLPEFNDWSSAKIIFLYGFIFITFNVFLSLVSSLLISQSKDVFENRDKELDEEAEVNKREKKVWMRKLRSKIDKNNRTLRAKELELSLAKEKLDYLEHAKSEFISVTTHQLRTPMSAIKWTFNMMLSEQLGPINEEQKEFLEKGYQSTLRTMSIVNNLVHLDHDEAEKSDYNFIPTDIVEFLNSISFEFSNQAESKKIDFKLKKPDSNLPKISFDPNKMRIVFENLLDNAIKYTPKEGEVIINIKDDKLNSAEPSIEVVISDSGVGIPKEEQKKIFHKFYRASNARRQEPNGSGIGLYIARDVVENHNGALWFNSVEGEGTDFHIVLPVNQKL